MSYHPALLRSLKDFNSGRYFEAHEHLEESLDEIEGNAEIWELFVGLIQIAVGYHKYASGYPGGEKMLGLGLEKVSSLPDVCAGVRLEELRQRVREDLADSARVHERLQREPPRIMLSK
jgi:predicted metal-dependent hydrolase